MQAVIIAGGYGTRLRPLTFIRPKPLIPILNKIMLLHIIDRLPREIDEIFLPVNYLVDQIKKFFDINDVGRNIRIVEEPEPLGTAGALKNVGDSLDNRFFVFNGDVISSINVVDMYHRHMDYGGVGTIALWEVDDPSSYGVVNLRDNNRISKFLEKPEKGASTSRLINAGIYIFEHSILNRIAKGKKVSLEREIFPKLIRSGLYGYKFEGYWADAGTAKSYLKAMKLLLASEGTWISHSARISKDAMIVKPIYIGSRSTVEGHIGPNVSIGNDCIIESAEISDSAIFSGVEVRSKAVIHNSIIGERCRIGIGTIIINSIVKDGLTIKANQSIHNQKVDV